ncbi:MAG: hypothetical protein GY798_14410 [Hyphomicrobiales bacterium]|nr:hypothetical protein [Hyphomicrobiales bacterium]
MGYLAIAFPGRSAEIAARRRDDPSFDEICRDFELISADLTRLDSEEHRGQSDQLVHLTSTLAGLHGEIAEHFEKPSRSRP